MISKRASLPSDWEGIYPARATSASEAWRCRLPEQHAVANDRSDESEGPPRVKEGSGIVAGHHGGQMACTTPMATTKIGQRPHQPRSPPSARCRREARARPCERFRICIYRPGHAGPRSVRREQYRRVAVIAGARSCSVAHGPRAPLAMKGGWARARRGLLAAPNLHLPVAARTP